MRLRFRSPAPAAALAALLAAGTAHATNGYFSHGYSVTQRALAGAGTAQASDALAVAVNPASLAFLPARFDVNFGLFSPARFYDAGERGANAGPGIFTIEPGGTRSARERFVIPALAYSHPLDDRSSWGVALYGNGGMNTEWRGRSARFAEGITGFEAQCEGTFGGGAPTGGSADPAGFCGNGVTTASVDLIQLFVVPSYARRIGRRSAVGIAPVIAAQRFRAVGMKAFAPFSNDPDKVSDNDYDYAFGAGARAGLTIGYFPYTTLGFSYQTRIDMSAFDKYAGLFAEQGDFDIPANWNAGVAFQLPWRQTLLFDYQKVDYDGVAAVGNPMDPNRFVNQCALPRIGGSTADSDACLGANTGPGFGWRDVTTRKLGWQLELGALTLRAGYSKNDQPIGASEVLFNILAPAVPEEHYTTGFAYPLGSSWAVGMSVMVAKNNPVTGKNPLSNAEASEAQLLAELAAPGSGNTQQAFGPDPEDQDITLSMRQYEVMLGLSYRFR